MNGAGPTSGHRGWVVASGALAAVVALAAGRGRLGAPPVDDLRAWVEATGPIVAAAALARLAVLAAAVWLSGLTVAVALAERVGSATIAGALARGLPRRLRGAATRLAPVGAGMVLLAATPGVGPAPAAATPPAPAVGAEGDATPVATMTVLTDTDDPGADTEPGPQPVPAPAPVPLPTIPATWTVSPGESFWSIAEQVLADALGRPADDREVAPYWRVLVDANRHRLARGDPDVIFAGQVFELPPT